jgi:ubiquinone/menaquinone biosynthesis C-methylase UbiE
MLALRFHGRKRVHDADEMMARITAERLVEHLERSGYVVMHKPPLGQHGAPGAASSFWDLRPCFEQCRCLCRLECIGGAVGDEIVAAATQVGSATDFPCRHAVLREHQQHEIAHIGPNSGAGPQGRQRPPFYVGHLLPLASTPALAWVCGDTKYSSIRFWLRSVACNAMLSKRSWERRMGLLNPEIEEFYRKFDEQQRLSGERGALEKLRTQAILARHLPPPPAVVIDVGGAAGAHAFPLAEGRGYDVHLVDPVTLHVEQASARAKGSSISLASIVLGDARKLEFASSQADAILLLGPLYHLTEAGDRIRALRETFRVLKPGGVLIAAEISRFASFIEALSAGGLRDAAFRDIIGNDLLSGQPRNSTGHTVYFTTAYFHRPEDLAAELEQAGFNAVRGLAVEGPGWASAGIHDAMTDPTQREKVLAFLSTIEAEPSILGASAHFVAIGRKPN